MTENDPYGAPFGVPVEVPLASPVQVPLATGPGAPSALQKLYTPQHVAIAAFLGSPLAGGIVLSASLRRLGRGREARNVLAVCVAATAALFGLAMLVPANVPGLGEVAGVWWLHSWAKRLIGPAVEAHRAANGPLKSSWSAAGVGLGGLTFILVAITGLTLLGPAALRAQLTDCVIVDKSEVCYEDGAKAEDARGVLEALADTELSGDKVSIKVSRPSGRVAVWFVVHDGAWEKEGVATAFTAIGQLIREKAFPKGKLEVRLADDSWKLHRTLKID